MKSTKLTIQDIGNVNNLRRTSAAFALSMLSGALCLAMLLFGGMQTNAQTAGTLDTTFGTGGKVVLPINANNNSEEITDLALQPDGKIIAGGYVNGNTATPPTSQDFGVKRFNPNGTLDASFGNAGSVSLDFDLGSLDNITAIALQPDGKILAAGFTYRNDVTSFAIARFNADGALDTTFGTNGKLKISVGNGFDLNAIFNSSISLALQPNGKFVVAGANTSTSIPYKDLLVLRFNADGTTDTSFGNGGGVSTRVFPTQSNSFAYMKRIALQPDGKIVLVGKAEYNPGGENHFGGLFVRYNADGSLDNSFGINGILFYDSRVSRQLDYVTDVRIEPDGKIIAAGGGYILGGRSILLRLNANSTFDMSFGTNGFVTTSQFLATTALVRRQADGKYVLGSSDGNNNVNFTAARYNNNGSVDTSFGPNGEGFISTDFFGGEDAVYAMLLQPDGKIVLAGSAFFQGGIHFALARYNGGSVVTRRPQFDFDGDGKADVSVFRPASGAWYLQQSQNGFTGISFGQNGDKIVPADYDGDGKTDVAVFRNGTWYLQRSQLGFTGVGFGAADDIPVPADYDGDGKADVAVFRPSTGAWYLLQSTLGFVGTTFGQLGDKPVAADYDGDGKADIAVNRSGTWYIQRSQLGFTGVAFGDANDRPVPADYDGDGKADVAVFRPSNGSLVFAAVNRWIHRHHVRRGNGHADTGGL